MVIAWRDKVNVQLWHSHDVQLERAIGRVSIEGLELSIFPSEFRCSEESQGHELQGKGSLLLLG